MKFLIKVLVGFLIVVALDAIAYVFLPADLVSGFPNYHRIDRPDVLGRGVYPKDYFVANAQRGFDIGANRKGTHFVEGITYPIWSNSLGCFDKEHNNYDDYVYVAGDSYTWGYAPFEMKFGTLIEQRGGATVLKCGVTHTGTRHHYEKLLETSAKVGAPPRMVVVFFAPNDVANDHFYPHSTVIDGWMMENVFIDPKDAAIRQSDAELKQRMDAHLKVQERRIRAKSPVAKIRSTVYRYSLSANVIAEGYRNARSSLTSTIDPAGAAEDSLAEERNIYFIPEKSNGRFWYTNNPFAVENKAAILLLRDFAVEHDAGLVFVLVPARSVAVSEGWFEELREFLTANEVRFIDLTSHFRTLDDAPSDLYWTRDPHFNKRGNEAIADILLKEIPELRRTDRRVEYLSHEKRDVENPEHITRSEMKPQRRPGCSSWVSAEAQVVSVEK